MMPVDVSYLLSLCEKAGQGIMSIYHKETTKIHKKKDTTPLTEADLLSNQILWDGLVKRYPGIPIISEESVIPSFRIRKNWTYCWLIDPMDGTREFIHKTGEFTINVALIHDHEVMAGFVHIPFQNKTYYAIKGHGAFSFHKRKRTPLQVSPYPGRFHNKRITISRFHQDPKTTAYIDKIKNKELIEIGSSLKILKIAEGSADLYPRFSRLYEWDIAATQIILEEAGGSVVAFHDKKSIRYNRPSLRLPAFLASSREYKKWEQDIR